MRVDAGGLVVSELAAADVDAVVLTPAHHYPTGVVMTAERRGALIAWARQRRALIVEDDYDVEYRFGRDPVASLQGLAPDLVAFVGTTSKTLAPALRLARQIVRCSRGRRRTIGRHRVRDLDRLRKLVAATEHPVRCGVSAKHQLA